MFTRNIYPLIKKHQTQTAITVLTGMRRTGKTTLVKQLLDDIPSQNKLYIDLERIDQRELFAEKNYENIIRALEQQGIQCDETATIALDEIQLVPTLPSAVKYLYDHYKIKFILTGSSSYYIKNLFTESLAGRKKIFELFPLTFGEFLTFKQIPFHPSPFKEIVKESISVTEYERLKSYYEEYIQYGGFPEVALADDIQIKEDILFDIVNSYLNIDIKSIIDFRNEKQIYRLMKALAARAASRIDYVKLASVAGMSRETVYNYVDLFEKTYLISRINVHTHNVDRELVKSQKLYFCDNGFLNMLADVDSGNVFENALFQQLKQQSALRYYALKNGKEIDFVCNDSIALEAKETPTPQDQKKLSSLSKNAGLNENRLVGRHLSPTYTDYVWGGSII